MVEHHLAKVRVAGPNPVFRSIEASLCEAFFMGIFVIGEIRDVKNRKTKIPATGGDFRLCITTGRLNLFYKSSTTQ